MRQAPGGDLADPHDLALWLENNRRAFGGENIDEEVTLTVQGEKRFHRNVITPIRDENVTYGILGMNIDLTERKRAEEALHKAHGELEQRVQKRTTELTRANEELALFRKFAETSGQGFSMADLDGRLTYLNPALCRMLGEEGPKFFLGKNLSVCYPPESIRRGEQVVQPALRQHGTWTGEMPMLSRQGNLIPTWHHTFVIRDERGNPLRLAVVITDITDRKRAEEALRQSERRFRNYFEQGLIGMAVTSVDKRWLEVNDRLCEMMGYSREELLQRSWTEVTLAEDLEPNYRLFDQLLAGAVDHFTLNKRYFKRDGSVLYATIHTRAFRKEDGTIDHIVTLVEDITARKHAEESLRRERRTLEYMLQSSDHERQLIAYDIHDGLAQELAGAIMQFQIYDQLKHTKPDEAQKAYQSGITLLRQSHCETRRLISGVRPPILDESGVVAAIAHLVHDPAFEQGPKIEFRRKVRFHRLAPVLENVIYRIVQESLTNARNHSQSDKILVSLIQRGDRLRIEIRDWGVGFDPKSVQENSFGLKGIRQRARVLRGRCRIQSAPGEGTVVRVELPVVALEVRG